METTPFIFGKIATDKNFTDRKTETEQLIVNFTSLINIILISPRRWGKSSLVTKAAKAAMQKDKSLRFCFIDLFNIQSEEQFYQQLAQEVLRASSSKIDGFLENARKFLTQLIPRISFNPDSAVDFTLKFDWQEVKRQPDEILDLAENIAKDKKLKFIVCIDEFQNIADFEDPLSLQKKLRSHWQMHQNTAYCLYGCKRHMMTDVFASPSMPFYKFGDILFLQKISEEKWVPFILKRFADTGKKISRGNALQIIHLADCHPYYVQQLAQQTWLRTRDECNDEIVMRSHENLILQLSLLFQVLTDELTSTQVNFLKALLNGEKQLSSKDILQKYRLGTSANVIRLKNALVNKEIIDVMGHQITLLDPMYKYWLEKYYFKIGSWYDK